MTEFPESARVGRGIPLAQLQRQGVPERAVRPVRSLVWAYKLAPGTVRLPATEKVKEIEVLDVTLRDPPPTPRALAAALAAIDRAIPNPLVFRVFSADGDFRLLACAIKVSGGALQGDSDLFRLFRTEQDVGLPLGTTDLESFLKRFAAAVADMETTPEETLAALDGRHYRLEGLRADLEETERKITKAEGLDRKYDLAKKRLLLREEMDACRKPDAGKEEVC